MSFSLEKLITAALLEDAAERDVTAHATVPAHARCQAELIAKQDGVPSGMAAFRMAFDLCHTEVEEYEAVTDGHPFSKGDVLARFSGRTQAVLSAERTALNLLQHLTGIATLTAAFVKAVDGTGAQICDTRKTMPLLRTLEKQAVLHGGGTNHRFNLADGVLIKENHITAAGDIAKAVAHARNRAHHLMKIEVEVTNLEQLKEALDARVEVVMLDNMGLGDMRKAVELAKNSGVLLEASGNMSLDRVREVAKCGVDFISVGALTHSAPAADISLLIGHA